MKGKKKRNDELATLRDWLIATLVEDGFPAGIATQAAALAIKQVGISNRTRLLHAARQIAASMVPQARGPQLRERNSRRNAGRKRNHRKNPKRKNGKRKNGRARVAKNRCTAGRQNANRKNTRRKRNVEMGYRSGGTFHPVRASRDYDAQRVGEKQKWSKAYPGNMKGRKRRNSGKKRKNAGKRKNASFPYQFMGAFSTASDAMKKAAKIPGAEVNQVKYKSGQVRYQVRVKRNPKNPAAGRGTPERQMRAGYARAIRKSGRVRNSVRRRRNAGEDDPELPSADEVERQRRLIQQADYNFSATSGRGAHRSP